MLADPCANTQWLSEASGFAAAGLGALHFVDAGLSQAFSFRRCRAIGSWFEHSSSEWRTKPVVMPVHCAPRSRQANTAAAGAGRISEGSGCCTGAAGGGGDAAQPAACSAIHTANERILIRIAR